jgi:hypothetical protein
MDLVLSKGLLLVVVEVLLVAPPSVSLRQWMAAMRAM